MAKEEKNKIISDHIIVALYNIQINIFANALNKSQIKYNFSWQ